LFGSSLEQQVAGLAVGVILAGVAQAAFQWPALRKEGFRLSMSIPWRDPTVRESFTRLVPATVGVAAYQFNVVATQAIGSLQADHVLASYNYAVRLLELPQGVIGVSVATYLLTELSRRAADKQFPEFRRLVGDGMLHLCFLNGLASILLAVLAEPIVRLLFEHGRFNEASTARAALALRMLAPGLLATSLTGILSRAFYALDDMRVPMRIGVFCLGMNVVLALLLAFPFQQAGLAAANALTAVLNAALLLYAFRRKMPKFDLRAMLPALGRMTAHVAMAGVVAWGTHALWDSWVGHAGKLRQAGAVFAPAFVALAAYVGASLATGVPQARDLAGLLLRKLRLRND
jgi:putative peptidoglycan lipid II flippase